MLKLESFLVCASLTLLKHVRNVAVRPRGAGASRMGGGGISQSQASQHFQRQVCRLGSETPCPSPGRSMGNLFRQKALCTEHGRRHVGPDAEAEPEPDSRTRLMFRGAPFSILMQSALPEDGGWGKYTQEILFARFKSHLVPSAFNPINKVSTIRQHRIADASLLATGLIGLARSNSS